VKQVGVTAMSDFRYLYRADFERTRLEVANGTFAFVLKAVKPSRFVPRAPQGGAAGSAG
jgi:hypothetical protein